MNDAASQMADNRVNGHGASGAARRQAGVRGFTFIEILIVMGIISMLVGGVIVAITIWNRKGPIMETENRVTKLATLAQAWRMKFDAFPPTHVKDLPRITAGGDPIKGTINATNVGIESLVQALKWPGFKAQSTFGDGELANTDEDRMDKAVAAGESPDLVEVLDAWGNPFVYVHSQDYAKYADGGLAIVMGESNIETVAAGDEYDAQPHRAADGTFINPNTFQIFSFGPDGEPNTEDDIGNWSAD